jgi:hypothetical protein
MSEAKKLHVVKSGGEPAGRLDDAHVVLLGLSAAIVSVGDERPRVLAVQRTEGADALPFGTFDPVAHRTLESGLRDWVKEQTGLQLGYVEQLYTFGDRGRHLTRPGEGPRVLSVGYLALTRLSDKHAAPDAEWRDWYRYFPWEDWRTARPAVIDELILPRLSLFAGAAPNAELRERRRERIRLCFGTDGTGWDEEKVLERYELLYEADLVPEARRDRAALDGGAGAVSASSDHGLLAGRAMALDHRRILATALGRLRGKLKYRPVVFELLPATFTLLQLQRVVEALAGVPLHKQNFRRLVETAGLVEGTGRQHAETGGRPAELFGFRREVLRERPAPGVGLPGVRR